MAAFGEDVSMGDFRPPQAESGEGDPEAVAGHTSDGSVLNVQIPTMTPRGDNSGAAAAGAGLASAVAFGAGTRSARNTTVMLVFRVGNARRREAAVRVLLCTRSLPEKSSKSHDFLPKLLQSCAVTHA